MNADLPKGLFRIGQDVYMANCVAAIILYHDYFSVVLHACDKSVDYNIDKENPESKFHDAVQAWIRALEGASA